MLRTAGTAGPRRTSNEYESNKYESNKYESNMNRRSFLSALVATPVLAAIAACGDPDQQPAGTDPTTPETTPGTTPGTGPASGIAHPTGADDVVLKLSYEGGFVPAGFAFVNVPALLVSGDARVFTQAAVPAIFPGPLLPSVLVRTITEQGLQALLGVANDAGLLATPPDYAGGNGVADAQSTVLTISANGGTFAHNAYALGVDNPESPARQTLLGVTTTLGDIEKAAGAASLGPDQSFVPTTYRLQARAIDPSELTSQDVEPAVVDWPVAAVVSLAAATSCARVDAAAVGSLFLDAKQNTYFKEGDIVYQLSVAGVLPGDPAC
jgi:hypothetical protein